MHQLIADHLRKVHRDFLEEVAKAGKLCVLKDLRFDGVNVPDYSIVMMQQLYLLRYFPAYLIEYYQIYTQLLKYGFLQFPLKVLSIGCGCGIDYYGAVFALKETKEDYSDLLIYTGVDRIAWHYAYALNDVTFYFIKQDIEEWTQLDEDDYNVIIFPKSIGEFGADCFNRIKAAIKKTDLKSRRMCLMSSIPDQRSHLDATRLEELEHVLVNKHGFECLDAGKDVWHLPKVGWLGYICNGFSYPEYIKEYVESLISQCEGFIANGGTPHKSDCDNLNRRVMLKADYMYYQIKRFERE